MNRQPIDVMQLYTSTQSSTPYQPKSKLDWPTYWQQHDQPWRTEPEISPQRQRELQQYRHIKPNIKHGIFPFGAIQLNRADIEWLLATHENGRGPVNWDDESQRTRYGLDLRGAHLSKVNLSQLPLAKLIGGLNHEEYWSCTEEQRSKAILFLTSANLTNTHLEHANLYFAHLPQANLTHAYLEQINLSFAHLPEANLEHAYLQQANLSFAHLEHANLRNTYMEQANLQDAHLEHAKLRGAHLEHAKLTGAHLERANLINTHLEHTNLSYAHLEQADLSGAHLHETHLTHATLVNKQGIGPKFVDVLWGDINLSVIDWSTMKMLGDTYEASQRKDEKGNTKSIHQRLLEYQNATRATYQFATSLSEQGLKAEAARFDYRARCLQRIVHRYKMVTIDWHEQHNNKHTQTITTKSILYGLRKFSSHLFSYLFSWYLYIIAGYGYRLGYCFLWYTLIITLFALLYWYLDPGTFTWQTALGESMAVFHGRGTTLIEPGTNANINTFALSTVIEAFFGLIIEVVLVATAIQRFFDK